MIMHSSMVMLLVFSAWSSLQAARVEKNVIYGMHSGLALLMDVHVPPQPNGYGVIVIAGSGWHMPLAYGSGGLKERAASTRYVERLLGAGYTLFAINHRAAPSFRYPAAVEDAQRAVRFVRHHAKDYGIDPARIGGFGGSSGGHLVSMLGTLDGAGDAEDQDPVNRQSSRLQCVVAAAAPSDLGRIRTERGLAAVTSFVGMPAPGAGPGSTEHKTFRGASPVTHVSADDAPMLLMHGDADETVPFEQSELMDAALRQAGVEVTLLRIAGAGHGVNFEGATNPPDYLGEMVRWFDRHLRAVR
jgi:acetyl esterase/lipase